MFERSAELFTAYATAQPSGTVGMLGWEVSKRLRQLDLMLDKVTEAAAAIPVSPDADDQALNAAVELAETYAECFYLLAWRLRVLLADNGLPGLGKFDPVGVRNVRNHLIEHVEEFRPDHAASVAVSGDGDVHLRLGWTGPDEPKWHDPGLRANADEFRAALEETLIRATP